MQLGGVEWTEWDGKGLDRVRLVTGFVRLSVGRASDGIFFVFGVLFPACFIYYSSRAA